MGKYGLIEVKHGAANGSEAKEEQCHFEISLDSRVIRVRHHSDMGYYYVIKIIIWSAWFYWSGMRQYQIIGISRI